jgi:hypothetical protein
MVAERDLQSSDVDPDRGGDVRHREGLLGVGVDELGGSSHHRAGTRPGPRR